MVKKPTNSASKPAAKPERHAKSTKKPVTIDLEAKKVGAEETPNAAKSAKPAPSLGRQAKESSTRAETGARTSTPKTSQPKTAPEKPVKPSGNSDGFFGKLSAGLAGGAIALIGAAGLQYFGFLPSPGPASVNVGQDTAFIERSTSVDQRLNELGEKLDQIPKGPAFDPLVLEAKIDEKLSALQEKAAEAQTGGSDTAALATQSALETIKSQIADSEITIATLKTQLATSDQKLANLQSAISSGTAGEDSGLAALSSRLDALDTELKNTVNQISRPENQTGGSEEANEKLASLGNALTGLQGQLSSLTAKTAILPEQFVDPSSIDARFDGLSDQLRNSADRLTGLEADIAAQNTALEDVRSRLENGAAKQTARALAATALKSQIDRGVPFADSLSTLSALMDNPADLDALSSFAESGVPNLTQLEGRFGAVQNKVLDATTPAPEGDTLSRLLASAKSFVKVKNLDDAGDNSVDGTLSRIEQALRSGQTAEAENQWQSLPDAGKQVSSQWHDQLAARLKADTLLAEIVQNFLSQTASQ